MNVPKRRFRSVAVASPGRLGLLAAVCLAFVHGHYGRVAHASPHQSQPVQAAPVNGQAIYSAKERRVRDEAAIRGEVLRLECSEQSATHVGMEGSKVVDPSPEMMRIPLAARPILQPASALVRHGANKNFTLVTVSDVEWKSKNQGRVWGMYYSGGGGFSSHSYVATRGTVSKANPTGWILKHGAFGCGVWKKLTVLHDGTATVIKGRSRSREDFRARGEPDY